MCCRSGGRTCCARVEASPRDVGAMVHRCVAAAEQFEGDVELLDLRTICRGIARRCSNRCGRRALPHRARGHDTAGFGAEIAAVVAKEAFWFLDAPVERLAPLDIPMPYHRAAGGGAAGRGADRGGNIRVCSLSRPGRPRRSDYAGADRDGCNGNRRMAPVPVADTAVRAE